MGGAQGKPTYQLLERSVLGKGSFGTVYEGRHTRSQEKVAIKRCEVMNERQADIVREIKNVQQIEAHKHICKFLDFQYDNNSFLLVMEYCNKGDLHTYMDKYAPNLEAQIKIMHQCTSAVDYMHSVYVINRNIKPANILFRTEGKAVVAKLCDFGLGKTIDNIDATLVDRKSILATEVFMAPELYAKKKYDHTVDNFALALICLAMVNYSPASGSLFPMSASYLQSGNEERKAVGKEMHEAMTSGSKLPTVTAVTAMDSKCVKGVKKVIIAMSAAEPKERMALKDVLRELEKLATVNASEYTSGSNKKAILFNSNLDITKTKARFDGGPLSTVTEKPGDSRRSREGTEGNDSRSMIDTLKSKSSTGSLGSTKSSPRKESAQDKNPRKQATASSRSGASVRSTETKEEQEEKAEPEDDPEIGYRLMRQMLEEQVKKKRELRERQAQQQAERLAAAMPLLVLLKLLESDSDTAKNFAKGDKVKIDTDQEKAQQLQINHGGWQDRMKAYLGKIGTVEEVKDGKIKVKFSDGESLMWNAHLLEKVDEQTAVAAAMWQKSKFKRHDNVRIKVDVATLKRVQSNCSAGWREGMAHIVGLRGAVHKIDKDMHVLVEFLNGDLWWIHPEVLETVDLSDVKLEAGDLVIILDDKAKVKELQKGHGEWIEDMSQCLGKSGVVRRVDSRGKAVVEVGKQHFIWNIKCCKLFAKSEELVMVMLRERLLGK